MQGHKEDELDSIEKSADELLRFHTADKVSQPSDILANETYLFWRITDYVQDYSSQFEERPVEGCLLDFLKLENAGAEEILDFATKRGVLGICPHVKTDDNFRYFAEPLELYRHFASLAKIIVSLANVIRKGLPLEETYRIGKKIALNSYYPAFAYDYLHFMVYDWWRVNTFRMAFPLWKKGDAKNKTTPEITFRLDFGNWRDGRSWDNRASGNPQGNTFPLDNWDSDQPKELKLGNQSFCHAFPALNWDSDPDPDPDFIIPSPEDRRPSPLFSVLAYQLLQVAKLPSGYHFCEECRIPFEWDGKRSKPRSDKPIRCLDCRENVKRRLNAALKRKARTASSVINNKPPADQ